MAKGCVPRKAGGEVLTEIKLDIWKVLTTLLTAGILFLVGWVIKVEVNMTQLEYKIAQLQGRDADTKEDVDEIERDFAALLLRQQKDEISTAKLQGDVSAILDKVKDIKKTMDDEPWRK